MKTASCSMSSYSNIDIHLLLGISTSSNNNNLQDSLNNKSEKAQEWMDFIIKNIKNKESKRKHLKLRKNNNLITEQRIQKNNKRDHHNDLESTFLQNANSQHSFHVPEEIKLRIEAEKEVELEIEQRKKLSNQNTIIESVNEDLNYRDTNDFEFIKIKEGKRRNENLVSSDLRVYDHLQTEFLLAIQQYKSVQNKNFVTMSEIYEIIRFLGYRRVAKRGEYRLERSLEGDQKTLTHYCNGCGKYVPFSQIKTTNNKMASRCINCENIDKRNKT